MRIINFSVNNFRGISGGLKQNQIDFTNINTLYIFGQNNSGKSTFLMAYDFFYHDSKTSINDYYRKDQNNTIEFEIEVELDERDKSKIETAAPKASQSYKAYLMESQRLRLKTQWTNGKKVALSWDPDKNDFVEKGYASVGLHPVFQSCLPRPIHIKAMPTEEEGKAILNEILKELAEARLKESELRELEEAREKIRELQYKMYRPDVMQKHEDSVNKYFEELFPNLKVTIEEKRERLSWTENKLGKEHDITFSSIGQDGKHDTKVPDEVNFIGHGTIRAAILPYY